MDKVFEIVDSTDEDGQYFTCGIFPTLNDATAAVRKLGNSPFGDVAYDEEQKVLEIRERKVGVLDWSQTGKPVAKFVWTLLTDENGEESWKIERTI